MKKLLVIIFLFDAVFCGAQIVPVSTNRNIDSGLTHYWKLGEGLTTTGAYDSGSAGSGPGTWNGTKTGSPGYYTTGNLRQYAGLFDGSTNYITTPSNSGFTVTSAFTLSVWIYPTASTSAPIMSSNNAVTPFGGIVIGGVNTSGTYTLRMQIVATNATPTSEQITTIASVPLNTWHNVVATYDGSQSIGGMKIYLDGIRKVVQPTTNTGFGSFTDRPWVIGANSSASAFFTGRICDARTYNRTLSDQEVSILANNSIAPALMDGLWHVFTNGIDKNNNRLPCLIPSAVAITAPNLLALTASSVTGATCPVGGTNGIVALGSVSWTSGAIYSEKSFLYGTFEASIKLGANSHGTLWTAPTACQTQAVFFNSYGAPTICQNTSVNWNELDPWEQDTSSGLVTNIWQNLNYNSTASVNVETVTDVTANFHLAKMVWSSTQIVASIDGVTTVTIPCATYGCSTSFNVPMYIILSNMLNSNFSPNPSNFPQTMFVQFVRHCTPAGVLDLDDEFGGPPAAGCI